MQIHRKYNSSRPSLFHFLSVLICVMAVLMFLAAALSLTSLDAAEKNIEVNVNYGTEMKSRNPIIFECSQGLAKSIDGSIVFDKWSEESAREKLGNSPFSEFLNDIGYDDKEDYLFFIVRPNGVDTYKKLVTVVNAWNREKSTASVVVGEKPDSDKYSSLPDNMQKHIRYRKYRSSYMVFLTTKLSESEKDQFIDLFKRTSSKRKIQELYQESLGISEWVDFGSELAPQGWNVAVKFDETTSATSIELRE